MTLQVIVGVLVVLVALAWSVWIVAILRDRRRPPPLRGEPVGFPAVPDVPVDADALRELERLAEVAAAYDHDALDRARAKRARRAARLSRRANR